MKYQIVAKHGKHVKGNQYQGQGQLLQLLNNEGDCDHHHPLEPGGGVPEPGHQGLDTWHLPGTHTG